MQQKKYTLEELNLVTIHDLRIILAKLGGTPSQKSRAEMIDEILAIQLGRLIPQRSKRGRKPKYTESERILNDKGDSFNSNIEITTFSDKFTNEVTEYADFKTQKGFNSNDKENCDLPKLNYMNLAESQKLSVFPENDNLAFDKSFGDDSLQNVVVCADSGAKYSPTYVGYGVFDLLEDGSGVLRNIEYGRYAPNVYLSSDTVEFHDLKKGDFIVCNVNKNFESNKFELKDIEKINGLPVRRDKVHRGKAFDSLVAEFVKERIILEDDDANDPTLRLIDMFVPLNKGQRGVIVAPSETGNSTILKKIATSIQENYPKIHLITLLLEERPEEITDFAKKMTEGALVATSFDRLNESHVAYAEIYLERAKRLVELGNDVVILVDSLTKLAKSYEVAISKNSELSNLSNGNSFSFIKRFLGSAKKIVDGGSLTIIATISDSDSEFDKTLYNEIQNVINMKLVLSKNLANNLIFPAIDLLKSGTKKSELALSEEEFQTAWKLRRFISKTDEVEGMLEVKEMFDKTSSNDELCENVDDFLEECKK